VIDTIGRYAVLYKHFAVFSIKRSLQFRVEFLFRILMDLAYAGVAIGAYRVVYTQTNLLAGWSYEQIRIFVAAWLVVDGLQMVLVNQNLAMFPLLVNRGDLDYYLVRPVSALFMVSLNTLTLNSCVNLFMWCGYLAYGIVHYPEPLSALNVAVFLALLLNGFFLYYLIRMLILIPTFWLHSALGLEALFFTSIRFGERPDDIFGTWVRRMLVSFVPFALMASVPTKVLLGRLDLQSAAAVLCVSLSLFGVLLIVWRTALRHYGSASS
jgi:ABC-2 type transport system permease protein